MKLLKGKRLESVRRLGINPSSREGCNSLPHRRLASVSFVRRRLRESGSSECYSPWSFEVTFGTEARSQLFILFEERRAPWLGDACTLVQLADRGRCLVIQSSYRPSINWLRSLT